MPRKKTQNEKISEGLKLAWAARRKSLEKKTYCPTCHRPFGYAPRRFCMKGLCVTVTPTTFIYTAGAEDGIAVGLINYPRFPKGNEEIWETAITLGSVLMDALCQRSFTVVSPDKTHWFAKEE